MQSIKLRSRVGADGILHLDLPVSIKDREIEVMVIYQPISPSTAPQTPEELGYSPNFFETTAGAWQGETLRRDELEKCDERQSDEI